MVVNLNNVVPVLTRAQASESGARPSALASGNPSPPSGNEPPQSSPIDTVKSIEHLTEFLSNNARGLRFSVDDTSGRTVVTVVNPNNGEVIRQIPTEEILQVANALRRYGEFHLVDDEA